MRSLLLTGLLLVTACTSYREQARSTSKDDDIEEREEKEKTEPAAPAAPKETTPKPAPGEALQRFTCTTQTEIDGAIHRLELVVRDISGAKIDLRRSDGSEGTGDIKVTPAGTHIASINNRSLITIRPPFTEFEGKGEDYRVILGLTEESGYEKGVLWLYYAADRQFNAQVACTVSELESE